MAQISGFSLNSKNILISVFFSITIFFSGLAVLETIADKYRNDHGNDLKSTAGSISSKEVSENKIAVIEIFEKPDGVYFKTQYNTKYFADKCEVEAFIIVDYYQHCMPPTTTEPPKDYKIKKL